MLPSTQPAEVTGRVLVVDDDSEVLELTVHLLKKAGHDVNSAETGEKCLEQVHQSLPDLILLDINLPDIDGFEVYRRLKSDDRLSNIFVVFCSAAQTSSQNIDEGTKAGGNGYIFRPVSNSELVARVNAYFQTQQSFEQIRNSEHRFRTLFDGNPHPIWVFDTDSHQVIDANHAALISYGYTRAEALKLSSAELFTEQHDQRFWNTPCLEAGHPAQTQSYTQQLNSKAQIETEITCHEIDWNGVRARALFVTDISEKLELKATKTRQSNTLKEELKQLEQGQELPHKITAEALGLTKLSVSAPNLFAELRLSYENYLEQVYQERAYRTDVQAANGLRNLAERMFILKCGPRDVTEIHLDVIKSKLKQQPELSNAVLDSGRMALLQLMGYLVAAYRNHHISRHAGQSHKRHNHGESA